MYASRKHLVVVAIEPFYVAKILVDHRKLLCVYNYPASTTSTFLVAVREKKNNLKEDFLKLIKHEKLIAS